MNINTGELFENRDQALKEAMLKGMSEIEAENQIMGLDSNQYKELIGMDRAARRRWAKKHRSSGGD